MNGAMAGRRTSWACAMASVLAAVSAPGMAWADDGLALVSARASIGVEGHFGAVEGAAPGMDATAGFVGYTGRWGLFLNPELGWSGTTLGKESVFGFDTHMFSASCAIGYAHPAFGVAWRPRLLVGAGPDGVVGGMRNSVVFPFVGDIVEIEAGYQILGTSAGPEHALQGYFGVNMGVLFHMLFDPKVKIL